MQIKETLDISFPGAVECQPLEGVVVLMDCAGVALGVQRTFSARVRSARDDDSGLIVSRCVEIPLVGSEGEVSGILCHTGPRSDTRGAVVPRERETVRAMADMAQFVVHDIDNLFAVIGSALRLLECQGDAAYRKAIVGKMQVAITRGALLSRQPLDAARPRPKSMDGFVASSRLAAIAGTLDRALRPDITVRIEIAPDLWDFSADPEELYFALLNLCRNAADAISEDGAITIAARNVELSAGAAREFVEIVEIVVADDGEGMTEEVLSQAFTPYFTTKAVGSGTGLGLAQVQRFAEGRGGAVGMERARCRHGGVPLPSPRARRRGPSSLPGTAIAYTPSPSGGVFHVVNPATAVPTS